VPAARPAPATRPQPQPQRDVVAVTPSHPTATATATGPVVVQPGDSLWSIAQDRLGAGASPQEVLREVDRLWSLNGLEDPDLIYAGQHLRT
jgi:nucleoid-associated protein YgaU